MDTMMPHSLGQGHICQSFAFFVLRLCYSEKASVVDTSVQLNNHLVLNKQFYFQTIKTQHQSKVYLHKN